MSAEVLRAAARLMRADVGSVSEQPQTRAVVNSVWLNSRQHLVLRPAVALAVADWLQHIADARQVMDDLANNYGEGEPRDGSELFLTLESQALTVARAYLGDTP